MHTMNRMQNMEQLRKPLPARPVAVQERPSFRTPVLEVRANPSNTLRELEQYSHHTDRMREVSRQNGIPGQVAYWEREKRDTHRVAAFEKSRMLLQPFGFHLQPFAVTQPGSLVVRGRNFDWFPKPIEQLNADDDFVLACHKAIAVARRVNAPLKHWHVFYPIPRKGWKEAFADATHETISWAGISGGLAAQKTGEFMRNGGWLIPLAAGAAVMVGVTLAGALSVVSAAPLVLLAVHDPVLCALPAVPGAPSDSNLHIQVVRWE